jgi:hypothetical protein
MVASVEGNGRKGGGDEGIVSEGLATTKASRLACRISYLLLTAQWRVAASRFRRRVCSRVSRGHGVGQAMRFPHKTRTGRSDEGYFRLERSMYHDTLPETP